MVSPCHRCGGALLVCVFLGLPSWASAQQGAPLSRWGATAPATGRVGTAVGGGWPAAFVELDVGVTERLATGLRVGYAYGNPHGDLRLGSGVLVEVPTRMQALATDSLELSIDVTPGMIIGLDRRTSALEENVVEGELQALAAELHLGVTLSWRVNQSFVLKFGLEIPATVVLAMTDTAHDDAWELGLALAPRVGFSYGATPWLAIFCVADVGPSLGFRPVDWTADHYEHKAGIELYFRAAAGLVFTPWR